MTKTQLILIASFLTALAAGVAAGVAMDRFTGRHRPASKIDRELNLTKAQREQMRVIWSEAINEARRKEREERDALRKAREERDQAIQDLLTQEQKVKYQEVMKTYADKTAALGAERRKPFGQAAERTKQILTEEQRKKYEELMKQGPGWNPRRGGPGKGGPDIDAGSTRGGPGKGGPGIEAGPPPDGE